MSEETVTMWKWVKDNIGYIIVIGLLILVIMRTTIEAGDYKQGIIMSLVIFIIILLLKNSELKEKLSKEDQGMIELLKELKKQGLIKEEETPLKEKEEDLEGGS